MGETERLTLEEIPDEYLASSDQPGQVVRIDYESNTYDEENRSMDKYAYVYLPYGQQILIHFSDWADILCEIYVQNSKRLHGLPGQG